MTTITIIIEMVSVVTVICIYPKFQICFIIVLKYWYVNTIFRNPRLLKELRLFAPTRCPTHKNDIAYKTFVINISIKYYIYFFLL